MFLSPTHLLHRPIPIPSVSPRSQATTPPLASLTVRSPVVRGSGRVGRLQTPSPAGRSGRQRRRRGPAVLTLGAGRPVLTGRLRVLAVTVTPHVICGGGARGSETLQRDQRVIAERRRETREFKSQTHTIYSRATQG